MQTVTYDPDASITANLAANGFGHRPCARYGAREIFRTETGEIIGSMDCFEATDWLKGGCPALAEAV